MSNLDAMMQANFHELNDKCKALKAKAQPLADLMQENNMKIRELRQANDVLNAERKKMLEDGNYVEMTKERSRMVNALNGKTGVHPNAKG